MRRMLLRGAEVLALIGIALVLAGCGGGKKPATVSVGGVTIQVPADMAGQVQVKTLKADALARLPRVNANDGAVAAAEFEPSGSRFEEGASVTWTLPEPMKPGSELWIVTFDNAVGEWLNTGGKAVVQPDGRTAVGAVHHFSIIALSKTPARNSDKDDPADARQKAYKNIIIPKFPPKKGGSDGHAPEAIDPKKYEAAKKAYEKWKGGPMTETAMCEIYRVADYKTVKELIRKGDISGTHSIEMADLRTAMVVETLLTIGAEKQWAIYRSDTGNQASGMASDMDQTLVVYEIRPDGREVRVEKADAELCKLFKERFDARRNGIGTEHFDICSIAGADKPPEWRLTQSQVDAGNLRSVKLHVAETMVNLRKTPGAYTYMGAIVSEVQLRVAKAMESKLRSQADIEAGKAARPEPRKQPLSEEVKKLGITSTEQIAMHKLGPDKDGNWRAHEVSREKSLDVMFNGVKPELLRGHAYDSAVANYLEHMHHVNDPIPEAKYPLRAVTDVGFILAAMDGRMPAGVEYESLSKAERLEYLRKAVASDLPEPFLKRWNQVLDMSAEMRLAHKDQKLNEAKVDALLEPLAKEYGVSIEKAATPEAKAAARETAMAAFRSRTQEFLTYNIVTNCKERVLDFLVADDSRAARSDVEKAVNVEDVKKALDPEGKMDPGAWGSAKELFQNYGEIARLQLLFSFRELPQEIVERCLREIESGRDPPVFKDGKLVERGGPRFTPEEIAKIKALAKDARSPDWAEKAFAEHPELYKAMYAVEAKKLSEAAAAHRAELAARWSENFKVFVLSQVGLGSPEPPSKIVEFLNARGWKAITRPVNNRAAAITGRVVAHYVCDPGSWQAGVEVMRAYAESDGDPKVWRKVAMQQALYMVPVFGQAKAAWDADWWNRGIMIVTFLVPEVGWFQMTLAVGESGLVIYENEFVRPITNGMADAAYKGWVGPALREFGVDAREVKPFTEEDEKALADLQDEIRKLQAREGKYAGITDPVTQLAPMLKQEQAMLNQRAIWEAYNAELNRYEHNDQAVHKRVNLPSAKDFTECDMNLPGPLLARVKPIVFYSRSNAGDVDLTLAFTAEQRARLDKLPEVIKAEADPMKRVELEEELDVLSDRLREYERAQRYLAEMKTNQELALQIRRDSLYPYRMTDESAKEDMKNPRQFVKDWLLIRRNILPQALYDVGVGDGKWNPHVFDDAGDELFDRFMADFERSKKLWLARKNYRAQLAKADENRLRRRQAHELLNALGEAAVEPPVRLSPAAQAALTSAGIDPAEAVKLHAVAEALRLRHLPEAPPVVKVGLVTSTEGDCATLITPDVKITANPEIYVPPYQVVWYQLGPEEVKAAYGSRTYRGLPLNDEDVKVLKSYLDELGTDKPKAAKDKDPVNPLFLTFVFCRDVKVPSRVIAATVDELPPLTKYAIPMPEGMEGPGKPMTSGYLFGSYACMLRPKHEASGNVMVRRAPNGMGNTEVIVTSEAIRIIDRPDADKTFPYAKFTLQVAPEKDGPWTTVEEFPLSQYDRAIKPIRPNSQENLRIAADKVLLVDKFLSWHFEEKKIPVGPLWYRVGQKSYLHLKEPKEEVLSDPVPPSARSTIHLNGSGLGGWNDWMATDRREITVGPGPNPSIEVALGVDNQSFLCPGAHLIFKESGRTFHYYTPRSEGPVQFGGMGNGYSRTMIAMTLPEKTTPIEMSAEWRNYQATREFTVTPHDRPGGLKNRQDWVDTRRREMDDVNRSAASGLKDYPASIARSRERLAERATHPPKNYGENEGYLDAELNIIRCEYQMRLDREYRLPNATMRHEVERAWQAREWPALAKAVRTELEVAKRAREIEIEKLKREKAAKQKAYAMPGAPANAQQDLAYIDRLIAEAKNLYFVGTDELCSRVAQTGDAALLRELYDLRIEQHKNTRKDTPQDQTYGRDLGQIYASYAEQWAMLTGEREQAAQLYAESQRIFKQPLLRYGRELPVWWPEGQSGSYFQPPEKPKDDRKSDPTKKAP